MTVPEGNYTRLIILTSVIFMQAYKTDATFFLLKSLTNVIFKGVTAEDLVELPEIIVRKHGIRLD